MKEVEDIKTQFVKMANRLGPATILEAIVTSVNADDTIDVEDLDGTLIPGVQLRATNADGNKWVLTPAVNSVVMIGRIQNSNECVLIAADNITAVKGVINDVTFHVTEGGLLMQKGEDTLKQALTLLIEAVQPVVVLYGENPVYVKLQQALDKVNNILL